MTAVQCPNGHEASRAAYANGCRSDVCRAASSEYHAERRARAEEYDGYATPLPTITETLIMDRLLRHAPNLSPSRRRQAATEIAQVAVPTPPEESEVVDALRALLDVLDSPEKQPAKVRTAMFAGHKALGEIIN